MLGMKNHFDISGSIEIREVDIAGVACTYSSLNAMSKEEYARKRIHNGCLIHIAMLNIYRRDRIFNLQLTAIKNSYNKENV